MKKLLLSAAVAFLGIAGANAQVGIESVEVGARAGYNYSNFTGDSSDNLDTEGLSGFHAGLFFEVPISDRFSIQPEVNYSTQGAKWDRLLGGEYKLKTQNINVPILAKIYVAEGFNVQVGPQVSFNTGSDFEIDGATGSLVYDLDDDALAAVNFGAIVGAGYKLQEGLSIDARYNFGLTNILDEDNSSFNLIDPTGDKDLKDGVFSIGLGYSF